MEDAHRGSPDEGTYPRIERPDGHVRRRRRTGRRRLIPREAATSLYHETEQGHAVVLSLVEGAGIPRGMSGTD